MKTGQFESIVEPTLEQIGDDADGLIGLGLGLDLDDEEAVLLSMDPTSGAMVERYCNVRVVPGKRVVRLPRVPQILSFCDFRAEV